MKLIAWIMMMAFSSAIFAQQPAANDQIVATWTRNYEGGRSENSLTAHSGVLESRSVSETGYTASYTVKLDNVRRFDKRSDKPKDSEFVPTTGFYVIQITTRGNQDIIRTYKDGHTKYVASGMWFASFEPSQQKLRDDTYTKLCALIGQAP